MFTAVLEDLNILRDSITSIAELIDETELVVRQDGLKLAASDRAVVVVVDLFLGKSAFKEYNYQSDMRFGVNLTNFLRILKRAGAGDTMYMKIDKNIEVKFIGSSSRVFTLPIIDVSKEELPPIDKLDFTSSFDISSETFSNAIDDADLISDTLVFTSAGEKLFINAEGDQSSVELELDGGTIKNFKSPDNSRGRYSIEYLKKIMKSKKISEDVNCSYSTDYPMKVVFSIPEKARLSFILAPRVEE